MAKNTQKANPLLHGLKKEFSIPTNDDTVSYALYPTDMEINSIEKDRDEIELFVQRQVF